MKIKYFLIELFSILVAQSVFAQIHFNEGLCFSEAKLSFGQQARCIKPLLSEICSGAYILQSCEKNTNIISVVYQFVKNGDQHDLTDPLVLQMYHEEFLIYAKDNYPVLYNIITYSRRIHFQFY